MTTIWLTLTNQISGLQYNLKRIHCFSTIAFIYFVFMASCSSPTPDSQGDNFNTRIDRVAAVDKSDAALLSFF